MARNYIEQGNLSDTTMQKTKEALLGTDRNLRLAIGNELDVAIKKLTRRNSTMTAMFVELKNHGPSYAGRVKSFMPEPRLERSDWHREGR